MSDDLSVTGGEIGKAARTAGAAALGVVNQRMRQQEASEQDKARRLDQMAREQQATERRKTIELQMLASQQRRQNQQHRDVGGSFAR